MSEKDRGAKSLEDLQAKRLNFHQGDPCIRCGMPIIDSGGMGPCPATIERLDDLQARVERLEKFADLEPRVEKLESEVLYGGT